MNALGIRAEFVKALPEYDRKLLDQVLEDCTEVVVFGSRAIGAHAETSDLDVLCVGGIERYRSEHMDIVRRTPQEVASSKWLGSELAHHIAAYGVALRGECEWREAVHLSEQAVSHKERRISALVNGLWEYWDRLHPDFKWKYLTSIRREGQRLQLLTGGVAVPPTPLLDQAWNREAAAINDWTRFFQHLESKPPINRELLLRTVDLIASAEIPG